MAEEKDKKTETAKDVVKAKEEISTSKAATESKEPENKEPKTETPKEEAESKSVAEEKKESVTLSSDAQKVMDMVEKMTVLELSELVKALEEKFGVSAAAPVAVAAAPGGATAGGEAPAEEKTEFDVVLKSAGSEKIAVIKVVRELDQTLGLVEAKNLVETADAVILTQAKKEAAEEAKTKLETAGATVELK